MADTHTTTTRVGASLARRALLTDHAAPLDREARPIYSAPDYGNPDSGCLLDASRMTARTLWNAGDARHVFALDQAADAILRDAALLESGSTDSIAAALTGDAANGADKALRHAIRDSLREHGIAVDITGLRRSRRVGSGRSSRTIAGGYVERQYSQVIGSPTVSARKLARMTDADRAELELESAYCHDARHTDSLAGWFDAAAHDIQCSLRGESGKVRHVTDTVDADTYMATADRRSHGARLAWSPRERIASPRRVKLATIERLAGDARGPAQCEYRFPADRPERRGDAPDYVYVSATVVEEPGPWIDDTHVMFGHRVVTVPKRAHGRRGDRADSRQVARPDQIAAIREAVSAVLAERKPRQVSVLGRTVVLTPVRGGKVSWETSSRKGGGSDPVRVAGRIIAAVAP